MREAVERAYREHGEGVFRFLVRASGDPDLAADVLQDTFRTLLERPPRHDGNLRGWLVRVAANRLRDAQRSRTRRTHALRRIGGARTHSDPGPTPEQSAQRSDDRNRALALLDALGQRDRTILLMREEGFTHREIAGAVGTTTASVGTMIARALDRLAAAHAAVEANR